MITQDELEELITIYVKENKKLWNNNIDLMYCIKEKFKRIEYNKQTYHCYIKLNELRNGDVYFDIMMNNNDIPDIYMFINITKIISDHVRVERIKKIDDILKV